MHRSLLKEKHMQPICTHKISVQSSKPSHAYPIIRLPREYQELAGSKAEIYQTTHQGKLAFLVATEKKVDNSCLLEPETSQENCFASFKTTPKSETKTSLFSPTEAKTSSAICPALPRCSLRESRSAGPIRVRLLLAA